MENVVVLQNPVAKEILCKLRKKRIERKEFRELLEKAGLFLAYEMARELRIRKGKVETELGVAECSEVCDEDLVIVCILRASIPMVNGVLKVFEDAKVGFVAASRVEGEVGKDFEMKISMPYANVPKGRELVIVDPMLATGSTISKVLRKIGSKNYEKVFVLSVISTEVGIKRVLKEEERAKIYTLAIDKKLDDRGFIVPGLGDAGDRAFS